MSARAMNISLGADSTLAPYLPPSPGPSVTVAALAGYMARIASESDDPSRALSQMIEAATFAARKALDERLAQ
jgi:hypothetical protein